MMRHTPTMLRPRWLHSRMVQHLSAACLFLLLATGQIIGADETNALVGGAADTNSTAIRADNNLPIANASDTNSLVLTPVDTNSPGFGPVESTPVILTDARPMARLDLQSFRIIWERNIFNPNRSGRYTRVSPPRREPDRPRRTESFALVGTMSYEKGRFAFFEGSSYEYQKVLETAGTIAGYRIAEIAPTHIKLESTNGQAIQLPVGMQMQKADEGEWTVTARPESQQSFGRASGSTAASGGESSEALKRLMQRREQEGNSETTNNSETPLVAEEKIERTDPIQKPAAAPSGGADDALKRLLQKREQELNK